MHLRSHYKLGETKFSKWSKSQAAKDEVKAFTHTQGYSEGLFVDLLLSNPQGAAVYFNPEMIPLVRLYLQAYQVEDDSQDNYASNARAKSGNGKKPPACQVVLKGTLAVFEVHRKKDLERIGLKNCNSMLLLHAARYLSMRLFNKTDESYVTPQKRADYFAPISLPENVYKRLKWLFALVIMKEFNKAKGICDQYFAKTGGLRKYGTEMNTKAKTEAKRIFDNYQDGDIKDAVAFILRDSQDDNEDENQDSEEQTILNEN